MANDTATMMSIDAPAAAVVNSHSQSHSTHTINWPAGQYINRSINSE